jgi:hypothetical protein
LAPNFPRYVTVRVPTMAFRVRSSQSATGHVLVGTRLDVISIPSAVAEARERPVQPLGRCLYFFEGCRWARRRPWAPCSEQCCDGASDSGAPADSQVITVAAGEKRSARAQRPRQNGSWCPAGPRGRRVRPRPGRPEIRACRPAHFGIVLPCAVDKASRRCPLLVGDNRICETSSSFSVSSRFTRKRPRMFERRSSDSTGTSAWTDRQSVHAPTCHKSPAVWLHVGA